MSWPTMLCYNNNEIDLSNQEYKTILLEANGDIPIPT